MHTDVIVVGAGLSGLACALTLRDHGLDALVVEAADAVGGRIRTDRRDRFLLDRGFQVLQTWYPEAQHWLDYGQLDLRSFEPGALVCMNGRMHRVSDVWRRPARLPEMLASPIGTLADKLRLLGLRRRCLAGSLEDLYARPETSALERLRDLGFSATMIERFFKPFFSGVFFEPELGCSSRAFEFVFRAFALGDTALPARGMEEIPNQLAARLPPGSIRTGTPVDRLLDREILLASGERLGARALVIATEGREAARLLGQPTRAPIQADHRGTTCLYFAADRPPFPGPYLFLNGEGRGVVNSVICPSNLSEHYAPAGTSLITVNCHGADQSPDTLETALRRDLEPWFGAEVRHWQRLAVYQLPQALPAQTPPVPYPGGATPRQSDHLWVCGEYRSAPSIHWALYTGRRVGVGVARALMSQAA